MTTTGLSTVARSTGVATGLLRADARSALRRTLNDCPGGDVEDLYELGGRVLSVFGPFGHKTLIELPTDVAQEMFPDGLAVSGRTDVVAATEREIAAIRTRDAALAEGAIAASAVAMAYQMQNPYNSATSVSMCAGKLHDAITTLRELAPPAEKESDGIDDLTAKREERRAAARVAAAANLPRT